MSSFWYTDVTRALAAGELDLGAAGDTIEALLVMEASTASTEEDVTFPGSFATLDEFDGAGYARVTATGQLLTKDNATNQTKIAIADLVFPSLGAGTSKLAGVVLLKKVTNDADSPNLFFIDLTPFDPAGSNVTVRIDTAGLGTLESVT